mmetsp:Transcript_100705/g.324974  ORF Transcript_100705/g.324974 Transcript_100705/m.324974 type:complete len:717 (-) Transcript_100705:135-2285(-)
MSGPAAPPTRRPWAKNMDDELLAAEFATGGDGPACGLEDNEPPTIGEESAPKTLKSLQHFAYEPVYLAGPQVQAAAPQLSVRCILSNPACHSQANFIVPWAVLRAGLVLGFSAILFLTLAAILHTCRPWASQDFSSASLHVIAQAQQRHAGGQQEAVLRGAPVVLGGQRFPDNGWWWTRRPALPWSQVDGGIGRSCRGADQPPGDTGNLVYSHMFTLDACKSLCFQTPSCTGVEHRRGGHCTVWTRTIIASAPSKDSTCLVYLPPWTNLLPWSFVEGGGDRSCRGATPEDDWPSYYTLHLKVASVDACRALCLENVFCMGIEHSVSGGRCKIWTRMVSTSVPSVGSTCLRYQSGAGTGNATLPRWAREWPWSLVDGGSQRACRGASPTDDLSSNKYVYSDTVSLEDCKNRCIYAFLCEGIEYHPSGKCEVWTKIINSSVRSENSTCLRYKRRYPCDRCIGFPEVDFISVPEVPMDANKSRQMVIEYNRYITCGQSAIHMVPGVYPHLWPSGGRWYQVQLFGQQLPSKTDAKYWWEAKNLHLADANANPDGMTVQQKGRSLSHFITWMDALRRNLQAVIIAESSGLPSRFAKNAGHPGAELEFQGVVRALLEEMPADWDLVQLDHGVRGVGSGAFPVVTMARNGWKSPYHIYRWTAEHWAGLALYMVSGAFLRQVPQMIHDHGFDAIDTYVGARCSQSGSLKCFSVKSAYQGSDLAV